MAYTVTGSTHGKKAQLLIDQYNASDLFRTGRQALSRELAESSTFGLDDKTFEVGLRTGTLSLEGLLKKNRPAAELLIGDIIGETDARHYLTWAPKGLAFGAICYLLATLQNSVELGDVLTDIVQMNAVFQSDGGHRRAVSLRSPLAGGVTTQGEVQLLTVEAGDSGNYTVNGSANFLLGDSNASIQTKVRLTTGWANAVVGGSSAAPVSGSPTLITGITVLSYTGGEDASVLVNGNRSGGAGQVTPADGDVLILNLGALNPLDHIDLYGGANGGGHVLIEASANSNMSGAVTIAANQALGGNDPIVVPVTSLASFQYLRFTFQPDVGGLTLREFEPFSLLSATPGSAALTFTFPANDGNLDEAVATGTDATMSTVTEGGTSVVTLSYVTADGNSAVHDNGAATARGATAHLHILDVSNTTNPTLTVKIQHSVNGTSGWNDLITFTAATAVGVQQLFVEGAVRQHLRASYDIGGSGAQFAIAVAVSRYGLVA